MKELGDAEKLLTKIPKIESFQSAGRELLQQTQTFKGAIIMGSMLRSECLLLIAAACNSEVGSDLARKELTSMMEKNSMVKEQDVHPVILSMAKNLMK